MPTVFWAVWMLVALSTLPVSYMLMPENCNGPTRLVVDIHQPNYTVQFGVCEDVSESCRCSTGDHSLQVVEAHIYSDNESYELPHGYHTFDVVVREPYMTVGVHHFKVDCGYKCILPFRHCKGKSRSLDLIVEVVDFELKPVEPDLLEDVGIEEGSHVTMMCSSGLDHTQGSNSSDIKTQFLFTAEGDMNITKSVNCTQELMNDGDWIVSRQNEPPYNCLLNISTFDSENAGEYSCTAFLPRDQSQYVADHSPSSIKLYMKGQGADNNEGHTIIIASVAAVAVAIVLVLILLVLANRVRKSRRRNRRTSPYTSLTYHRSRQSYGAISQLSIPSAEGESRTLVGSDIEAPSEAPSSSEEEMPFKATPTTVIAVSPDGVRDEDSSLEEEARIDIGHPLTVENELEAARSRESTISEGTEGRQYYKDHTAINRPEDGCATPDEPDAPHDDNFTCEHCGKKYRTTQRLYYKRHMDELETRCPKYKPGPVPAPHPALSVVNVSPISSGLNVPNILLPKDEDKKDDKDTSFQASGSDVSSLPFMTESSGPPSNVSTQPSSSSSGPPSSVGQEGQQIYDNAMEIKPAIGPTPESHFPVDPHYTCPHCGRQYHGDQRLFLVRHLNENRCLSCSGSTGGGKQESKEDSNEHD